MSGRINNQERMKFNWGTGILITVILIFSGVVGFFLFSLTLESSLVETNYYEKELLYQERINRIRNTESLEEKIRIKLSDEAILILYPSMVQGKVPEGTVWFYRPSDETKDFRLPVNWGDTTFQLVEKDILPGKWMVKIDWKLDGIAYYQEESIIIN